MSKVHTMIPIQLQVNPADHEKIEEWRNNCLWKTFDDREMEYFIRDIQKCAIKSGFVLVYDDDGQFKSIPFRAKKIMEPKNEEVVIRVKHLRKNAGLTFDEKIDTLNKFVNDNNRQPTNDDVVDGFNLGKFYSSLKKNRDKYQFFIDNIGKLEEMDVEVEEDEEEAPKENVNDVQEKEDKPLLKEEKSESDSDDYQLPPVAAEQEKKNKKSSKKSKKE